MQLQLRAYLATVVVKLSNKSVGAVCSANSKIGMLWVLAPSRMLRLAMKHIHILKPFLKQTEVLAFIHFWKPSFAPHIIVCTTGHVCNNVHSGGRGLHPSLHAKQLLSTLHQQHSALPLHSPSRSCHAPVCPIPCPLQCSLLLPRTFSSMYFSHVVKLVVLVSLMQALQKS